MSSFSLPDVSAIAAPGGLLGSLLRGLLRGLLRRAGRRGGGLARPAGRSLGRLGLGRLGLGWLAAWRRRFPFALLVGRFVVLRLLVRVALLVRFRFAPQAQRALVQRIGEAVHAGGQGAGRGRLGGTGQLLARLRVQTAEQRGV